MRVCACACAGVCAPRRSGPMALDYHTTGMAAGPRAAPRLACGCHNTRCATTPSTTRVSTGRPDTGRTTCVCAVSIPPAELHSAPQCTPGMPHLPSRWQPSRPPALRVGRPIWKLPSTSRHQPRRPTSSGEPMQAPEGPHGVGGTTVGLRPAHTDARTRAHTHMCCPALGGMLGPHARRCREEGPHSDAGGAPAPTAPPHTRWTACHPRVVGEGRPTTKS